MQTKYKHKMANYQSWYKNWTVYHSMLVSVLAALLLTSIYLVLRIMTQIFDADDSEEQSKVLNHYGLSEEWVETFEGFEMLTKNAPGILSTVLILFAQWVYSKIVKKAMWGENHQYRDTHDGSRTLMQFRFDFVNYYFTCFLLAFMVRDQG